MNPLLWTSKSLRSIASTLLEKGFKVSYVKVVELLKSMGFSLQANKKTDEGGKVEDRNEQFEYINSTALKKILGLHHQVNDQYMQNYLNEFCYKFNRRFFGEKLFDRLLISSLSEH